MWNRLHCAHTPPHLCGNNELTDSWCPMKLFLPVCRNTQYCCSSLATGRRSHSSYPCVMLGSFRLRHSKMSEGTWEEMQTDSTIADSYFFLSSLQLQMLDLHLHKPQLQLDSRGLVQKQLREVDWNTWPLFCSFSGQLMLSVHHQTQQMDFSDYTAAVAATVQNRKIKWWCESEDGLSSKTGLHRLHRLKLFGHPVWSAMHFWVFVVTGRSGLEQVQNRSITGREQLQNRGQKGLEQA